MNGLVLVAVALAGMTGFFFGLYAALRARA